MATCDYNMFTHQKKKKNYLKKCFQTKIKVQMWQENFHFLPQILANFHLK